MAVQDPRNYLNPPTFRVRTCARALESQIGSAIDRKNTWAGTIGKLGDLDIWDKVHGGGRVGYALRGLAKISNSVRSGNGALPSIVGSGADWVLNNLGLNNASSGILRDLNPGAFNRAYGQAQNVYDMIKSGKFRIESIPHVFQDLQELEQLARGILNPTTDRKASATYEQCGASPYAMDLIAYAPKYKFLFVVEFIFEAPFVGMKDNKIAFVVKSSTRPKVNFEYEDVNYYNFRSRAIKKANYDPISMKFLDDDLNHAMQFFTTYLKLMSPIANMSNLATLSPENRGGMEFNKQQSRPIFPSIKGDAYTASIGTLKQGHGEDSERENIIKQINLYHVYRQGRLMNIYQFLRPRITDMDLDELAMDGDVNEVSLTFNYDGMFIIPSWDLSDTSKFDLNQLTDIGKNAFGLTYIGNEGQTVDPDGYPGSVIESGNDTGGSSMFKTVIRDGFGSNSITAPITGQIHESLKSVVDSVGSTPLVGGITVGSAASTATNLLI